MHTVGHCTLTEEAFVALVQGAGVSTVVDVRRYPGSRRNPQFGRDVMASWLGDGGFSYVWMPSLGGRRSVAAGSVNTGLRNEQFRAYADHMASPEFREGVDEVMGLPGSVAVMCAETLWWRCHRRLLADYLVLVRGVEVLHLVPGSAPSAHVPTAGAAVDLDGVLRYSSSSRREL